MITLIGKIKNAYRRIVLQQKDFSGYIVTSGQVLDLGGSTVTAAKSLSLRGGTIKNGTLNFSGEKHSAAINCEKGFASGIDSITTQGGSYNGLAKVWGDSTVIANCNVLPGTGWGVQILGAHKVRVDGLTTKNLRRGGIYLGSGNGYGTAETCDDCIVSNCRLDGADEESPLRTNVGIRLLVSDCWIDNTRSSSGKEAVQLRGISGVLSHCVVLGSTSSGQTPVGQSQTSTFTIGDSTIYGYSSIEAGGNITFDNCTLVQGKSFVHAGKTYTLMTPGNGYCINCQAAARGLPDGRATVKGGTVIGRLTPQPKKVVVTNNVVYR